MSVNGVEYTWENMTVTALGRPFGGISEVEYDTEVDKKIVYGRGRKARGIQNGNEKCGGSLSLKQSEVESMIRTAQANNPTAKLTDISFDIQVHYLKGTQLVKDKIIGAEFTKQPKSFKQGDAEMDIKLPFLAMDIVYNAQ